MEKPFEDPHVGIARIYTRTGDDGTTGLVGGQRIPKTDRRIRTYGNVDYLGALIGTVAAHPHGFSDALRIVQQHLFNLGSILATLPEDVGPRQPRVTEANVAWLERQLDAVTPNLPPLRSFLLAGADPLDAAYHVARAVCRQVEIDVLELGGYGLEARYLNRLSDALFAWGRARAAQDGVQETLWDPNRVE